MTSPPALAHVVLPVRVFKPVLECACACREPERDTCSNEPHLHPVHVHLGGGGREFTRVTDIVLEVEGQEEEEEEEEEQAHLGDPKEASDVAHRVHPGVASVRYMHIHIHTLYIYLYMQDY